ncbi:MAG: PEP-CTERM sorting domain-containing protein [Burkholderiaceae bacterium]|nr:PEP-CTERM sorting domain-containing protein [Burkholderiaceae bacterium]
MLVENRNPNFSRIRNPMKSLRATIFSVTAVVAGLAMSQGAFAQSTWSLKAAASGGACSTGSASTYGNTWSCTGATASGKAPAGTNGPLALSAWSTDRGTLKYAKAGGATYTTGSGGLITYNTAGGSGVNTRVEQKLTGSGYASAYLSQQSNSGFGAGSRDEGVGAGSPNHAFDSNLPGTQDVLLLSFASSVILDQIGIGWSTGDSDITLMRWTGASAPTRTTGTTLVGGNENLSNTLYNGANPGIAGWELVGSYADLVAGTPRSTGADLEKGSSWWLISTFNTDLNGGGTSCKNAAGAATTCSQGNDAFKLNFVATLTPKSPSTPQGGSVPEPGSMALAGVALAATFGVRKRKAQQV